MSMRLICLGACAALAITMAAASAQESTAPVLKKVVLHDRAQPVTRRAAPTSGPREFVYDGIRIPRGPAGGCGSLLCPGFVMIGVGG